MELKPRGDRLGQRHLAPENLESLKSSLSEQLEVVKSSGHPKLEGKLDWQVPDSQFITAMNISKTINKTVS